jgi:hypothetical protein
MSGPAYRLIPSSRAGTPDQPRPRVPVTRRIVAELDRAPNVPLIPAYLGRRGYPGPLTGLPESRTYVELARAVYETAEPTAAQVKAVQRAAKRMVDAGLIERLGRGSVRRVPTEADHEYRAEVERRVREWQAARAEAEAGALDYPVDTGLGGGGLFGVGSGIKTVKVAPVLIITENGVSVRETA